MALEVRRMRCRPILFARLLFAVDTPNVFKYTFIYFFPFWWIIQFVQISWESVSFRKLRYKPMLLHVRTLGKYLLYLPTGIFHFPFKCAKNDSVLKFISNKQLFLCDFLRVTSGFISLSWTTHCLALIVPKYKNTKIQQQKKCKASRNVAKRKRRNLDGKYHWWNVSHHSFDRQNKGKALRKALSLHPEKTYQFHWAILPFPIQNIQVRYFIIVLSGTIKQPPPTYNTMLQRKKAQKAKSNKANIIKVVWQNQSIAPDIKY